MTADDVLAFWFGDDANQFRDVWFEKNDAFDAEIRERFGFTTQAAIDGALDAWANTATGTLALVIVLDQFPRNLHRGSYLAFAGGAHSRRIARNAIAGGVDALLTPVQRVFLYMPLCHSEELADQDQAVRLCDMLDPPLADVARSAREHRETIRRFGRFPLRNAALGRESAAEEVAYIAASDGVF